MIHLVALEQRSARVRKTFVALERVESASHGKRQSDEKQAMATASISSNSVIEPAITGPLEVAGEPIKGKQTEQHKAEEQYS